MVSATSLPCFKGIVKKTNKRWSNNGHIWSPTYFQSGKKD
jgi:hypothetical protein